MTWTQDFPRHSPTTNSNAKHLPSSSTCCDTVLCVQCYSIIAFPLHKDSTQGQVQAVYCTVTDSGLLTPSLV
eukprot:365023-Chlamydomonas_euryale.AAC.33